MLKNELYQGNKKPDTGKMPGVAKVAGDKSGERKPGEGGSVKNRGDAAWGDKTDLSKNLHDDSENITSKAKLAAGQSSEFAKTVGDKSGERTPAEDAAVKSRIDAAWGEKPAASQTPSAYPEVKPIVK